jgi:dTDP-4-dehydrorhamnose 3,5-epimerase
MRLRETPLAGAFLVEIEAHADTRGFFARTWCAQEFAAHGLRDVCVQASISHNERAGTVRGMHLQLPPSQEAKLVRCTRGAIFDVIIDLRPQSRTYRQHFGVELSSQVCNALYIPAEFAHGFQTLADETDVLYQMSDFFAPALAYGVRWSDPAFGIAWPRAEASAIHPRDAGYPDFDRTAYEAQRRAAAGDPGRGAHA